MVGGVLGMMLLAIMAAAKEADESFVIPKEQAQTGCFWTGECFWCEAGECMLETSNDAYVCPVCGWRYKGERESE